MNLVGHSPWRHKESDTTEWLSAQYYWRVMLLAEASLFWRRRAFTAARRAPVAVLGGSCQARALGHAGSVAVTHGLSRPIAYGIFLGQESDPCPLLCQMDS